MRLILNVVEGPLKGRTFELVNRETFVVGRSRYAQGAMPEDTSLSRDHFAIDVNPPNFELRDLNSTNGTYVNDRKVIHVRLLDGDRIAAGSSLFVATIVGASNHQGRMGTSSGSSSSIIVGKLGVIHCASCKVQAPKEMSVPQDSQGPTTSGDSVVWLCSACRAKAAATHQPIPNYTIVRELGRGAMGVVYLATHKDTGQTVALKLIIPEIATARSAVERFAREIEALRQLQHSNIVQLLDHGISEGRIWFAMEYVEGLSVEELAKSRPGAYPISRACRMTVQILKGLEHAHAMGIVHRDVKPENILVGQAPNGGRIAKLSDFGLAKCYRNIGLTDLTFSGELRGTIPFMPPEQIHDFRSVLPVGDLYSLAASLYYLIAGEYLFDISLDGGDGGEMIRKMLEEEPIPIQNHRPDVSPEFAAVLAKCLARDPKDRFPNAKIMRRALKPFCEEQAD